MARRAHASSRRAANPPPAVFGMAPSAALRSAVRAFLEAQVAHVQPREHQASAAGRTLFVCVRATYSDPEATLMHLSVSARWQDSQNAPDEFPSAVTLAVLEGSVNEDELGTLCQRLDSIGSAVPTS